MKFDCPHGWKSVAKVGSFTWESSIVNICDGICDSGDLCGIESCEFYDSSPEATRRFIRALTYEQTGEFQFAKPKLRTLTVYRGRADLAFVFLTSFAEQGAAERSE